jgi:hypothetical protein
MPHKQQRCSVLILAGSASGPLGLVVLCCEHLRHEDGKERQEPCDVVDVVCVTCCGVAGPLGMLSL